jgi:hypothetical protein
LRTGRRRVDVRSATAEDYLSPTLKLSLALLDEGCAALAVVERATMGLLPIGLDRQL